MLPTNTLPILQLLFQQLLSLVHKCVYHKAKLPMIFHDYFPLNESKYSYDTRNKLNFHLYSVNTTFGQ